MTKRSTRPPSGGAAPTATDAGTGKGDTRVRDLETQNRELRASVGHLNESRQRLGELAEKVTQITHMGAELGVLDLARLAEVAVTRIPHLIGAVRCNLYLLDRATEELVFRASTAIPRPPVDDEEIRFFPPEGSLVRRALESRRMVVVADLANRSADEGPLTRTPADDEARRSVIVQPLVAGKQALGVLALLDKANGEPFEETTDIPAVEQLGQILALSIHNCELVQEIQRQARTDDMTRLGNYRAFRERLEAETHRALRYARHLSIVLMDIDNFKPINDTWGHAMGDRILKEVAGIVRSSVRREDMAARYGGDELVLVLPETPLEGARVVAERIHALARALRVQAADAVVTTTLSIGVAAFKPSMDMAGLIRAADEALYESKRNGRDRVTLA